MLIRLSNKKLLEVKKVSYKPHGIEISEKGGKIIVPYIQIKWISEGKMKNGEEIKDKIDS